MPELPEVETVRSGLAPHLTHRRIERVMVRRRDLRIPLPSRFEKTLAGKKVTRLARRAKYLLFHLDNAQVLVVHLGMSGSLVLHDKKPQLRPHDHVIVEWEGGLWLVFHDPRRFGLMTLVAENALATHKLFAELGPEPLEESLNGSVLYKLLQSSRVPAKSLIMDQRKLVGVGNIYACEALFASGIHPGRNADKITRKEADRLAAAIKDVLGRAIASGGSTLRDYVRSSGAGGYFQHQFQIYGRKNLPCMSCTAPVQVIRQSGRSTFFCSVCQK